MADYSNWKIKKSELDAKLDEYSQVAEWCNENDYTIVESGNYYKVEKLPKQMPLTHDEIKQMRNLYRRKYIDDQTIERSRKMANSTWTDEDEQAYLALDAEVTTYIEQHFPYNEE